MIASAALIVAAVPMALGAVAVKLTSRGPILFRQTRVGRNGEAFCLYKLRTMAVATADGPQVTTAGDRRVSVAGRWLRKLKIDELPQLWNVIRGDMRLIGARPEVPRFVARYSTAQREILNAEPGLASMSQLVYPHESDLLENHPNPEEAYVRYLMPAKIAVDLRYERRRTFWTDLGLMFEMLLLIAGVRRRIDHSLRIPIDPVRQRP